MNLRKYLWELAKLLKRGKIIMIKPSMKCNLKCPYCSVNWHTGKPPEYDEHDYQYWIYVIMSEHPKMVAISGGEPGIYTGLHHIVNYCVANKILVQIVTNLTDIKEYVHIQHSWRVTLWATYHHASRAKSFELLYDYMSKRFHITVKELESPKVFPFSRLTPLKTEFSNTIYPYKIIAPDGRVFNSCYEIDISGK